MKENEMIQDWETEEGAEENKLLYRETLNHRSQGWPSGHALGVCDGGVDVHDVCALSGGDTCLWGREVPRRRYDVLQ